MQKVYRMVDVVAPTNYNVILYGESGTGKEVIARMIHEKSLRRNRPFVAVDCGILSRELSGSELFGHVKGAFTGALYDRDGHFATANGGTLFLDEVANLPPEVQTTLLRVIQERRFRPVGSSREQPADVRVVVASNESLIEAHQKGRFREDLYYRFNEFMILLPPLRERKEDIIPLAQLFMQKAGEETASKPAGFERNVYSFLREYSWPGNLRELKNMIRRAVLLTAPDQLINLEVFPPELWNTANTDETARKTIYTNGQPQPVADSYLQDEPGFEGQEDITTVYDRLKGAANKAEYQAILEALKKANFNKKKAAAILNIDRKTLYNKLKNFRLRYSY
jgi:two-component system response regulator HydG